jgi:hypothetical protein
VEFFNSLGQVMTQAKHYPAWEQQEKQKEARQQALVRQHN